jgi:hypothetical protein
MARYEAERVGIQPLLELNGNRIAAAIIFEDYWLLFGGRFNCKMKVTENEWNEE